MRAGCIALIHLEVFVSQQFTNAILQNCLGNLPDLVTLNITTWPGNSPASTKLPRKVYEYLLANLAQQGFERSSIHAKGNDRSSKLGIIAFGSSDKVYDREDSQNQISKCWPFILL